MYIYIFIYVFLLVNMCKCAYPYLHLHIFLSLTEHLQRTSFCDLFLDNREYNSGTTCTDSLWAG